MSVILSLVGLDTARPINCQVSAVSYVHFVAQEPNGLHFQGLDHFYIREQALRRALVFVEIAFCTLSLFFIGLWLLGAFRCFVLDRTSQVSTSLLCFPIILSFPNWILVEPDSIAIWNKNKIVIALTISVWATHLACIIQGK